MSERVRNILRKELSEEEFQRVLPVIDLLFRNRKIRLEFQLLIPQVGSKRAMALLAERFCLSEATIDWIVYKRRK